MGSGRKLVANSSGSYQNPTPFLPVSPLTFSRARPAALLWSSWSKRRGRREGQYHAEMSMRSALNIFKHLTTSNYESRQSNCINWCKLYLMSNTKNNTNILFTSIYSTFSTYNWFTKLHQQHIFRLELFLPSPWLHPFHRRWIHLTGIYTRLGETYEMKPTYELH